MFARIALAALLFVSAAGCATASRDRGWVSDALRGRVGHGIAVYGDDRDWSEEGLLANGLDEDEAVQIALYNSPTFQMDLVRLETARADFDEASRIANPQINLLGPIGPITAIAALIAPLESLWQLPQRTEAAGRQLESIAESLVSSGLDLMRDVRVAHVEVLLGDDRIRVRSEMADIVLELARIQSARERVGDATPVESSVVIAEAHTAADARAVAATDRALATARLWTLLGMDGARTELAVTFSRPEPASPPNEAALIAQARAHRPDVRSAELAIEAAAARAGWERSRVVALALAVDFQWSEAIGPAVRVGARIDLPIFGANPGGIGRADADVQRTTQMLDIVRQRAVMEVSVARERLMRAITSLVTFRRDVLPALAEAQRAATLTFEVGEESYLVVLDVLRRSADARLREAELVAEARRAEAELERAVGGRIEELP